MSGKTVHTCEWCGLRAPADGTYLPKGWAMPPGSLEELCVGCIISRALALEKVKAERKDINQNKGSAS
jgi:hypothetical protein